MCPTHNLTVVRGDFTQFLYLWLYIVHSCCCLFNPIIKVRVLSAYVCLIARPYEIPQFG